MIEKGDTATISYADSGTLKGHVCNCIGCCRICGQCRTAPWHARTCAEIASLNRKRAEIMSRPQGLTG